jgi:signal transduction histidine kinase
MKELLKILILEDSPLDVELIRTRLKKEFNFIDRVVYEQKAYLDELVNFSPDIILSDFSMPQFNGLEALALLQRSMVTCPFIIITGAIDEETAVSCIKAGANDYLLKDRLTRLPAAIKHSIAQHKAQIEKEESRKALEKSHVRLRDLLNRLEIIRDEEKKRISMEIHDQLGQELTANKLGLFYVKQQLIDHELDIQKSEMIKEKIDDLIQLSGNTLKTVRRIAHQLRPVILKDLGLISAIEWMINRVKENSGINWEFINKLNDDHFNEAFTNSAYRIIQEAITNVLRHADAQNCWLSLSEVESDLYISIKDDGNGFDLHKRKQNGKLGLFGMEERVIQWQGSLSIKSNIEKGTEIIFKIPMHTIRCNDAYDFNL